MSRYTKSERAKYLEKYSRYQGTQRSFCESAGINLGTFQYWLRESRQQESGSGFVEILKAQTVSEREYVEITTRSGTTIRIPL